MAIETITWKDPSGTSHPFDGSGNYLALEGEQGNYMPPVAPLDQRTPQRPGTTIRYFDIQQRLLTYPLVVTATTEMNLRTAIRQLTEMFYTPAGSPGTLIATAPDGSQRQCSAYYWAGLTGDGTPPKRGPGNILLPLQLLAADPFWYDTSATVSNYTNTQFLAGFTITNSSDFLVWPTWVITGPFTNLVITNTTTGQAIKLTANSGLSLTNGQTLTINTQAGTLIGPASANEIGFLTTDSVLFALATGANVITVSYTGGVLGQTTGQCTYTNRWFSC